MSDPKQAAAVSITSKPKEPVLLELVDAGGNVIGFAVIKPHTFERMWDRLGEAMSMIDVAGLGEIRETWEL